MVSYDYDSWGKLLDVIDNSRVGLGIKNPYRYRGYRYDTETGLYYLNSRYYNPEWGRFINSDSIGGKIGELLSHNIFVYCRNNAIKRYDHDGYSEESDTMSGEDLQTFTEEDYIELYSTSFNQEEIVNDDTESKEYYEPSKVIRVRFDKGK